MIELKNITYSVKGTSQEEREILKDLSAIFEEGKTYVITGPNGSGKSTLARLIMGINPLQRGEIFFDGQNIGNLSITQRAKAGICYAFQKPVTFKGVKIKSLLNIASGKENNVGGLCEYLSAVGLCAKDYIHRPFDDKLSGGEQKRIELALTLARNAKVNIFDEPEAGIDIWSFEKLTSIFKKLKKATNIIISHQSRIFEIADEIILLENGQIVKRGSYKQMKKHLQNARCGKLGGEA